MNKDDYYYDDDDDNDDDDDDDDDNDDCNDYFQAGRISPGISQSLLTHIIDNSLAWWAAKHIEKIIYDDDVDYDDEDDDNDYNDYNDDHLQAERTPPGTRYLSLCWPTL